LATHYGAGTGCKPITGGRHALRYHLVGVGYMQSLAAGMPTNATVPMAYGTWAQAMLAYLQAGNANPAHFSGPAFTKAGITVTNGTVTGATLATLATAAAILLFGNANSKGSTSANNGGLGLLTNNTLAAGGLYFANLYNTGGIVQAYSGQQGGPVLVAWGNVPVPPMPNGWALPAGLVPTVAKAKQAK
jgi:hypothetical protein